jgi:hypothetical protein
VVAVAVGRRGWLSRGRSPSAGRPAGQQCPRQDGGQETVVEALVGGERGTGLRDVRIGAEYFSPSRRRPEEHLKHEDVHVDGGDEAHQGVSGEVHGSAVLDDLLFRCDRDPGVVGALLTGSRARDGMATGHSDFDVYVIVTAAAARRWQTTRTAALDTIVMTLARFREPGEALERYAFAHARVLRDRLDGEIARLASARGSLGRDEARALAGEALDGYLNFAYRAAKNRRDGRLLEARLDAAESAPWLLTTIFAFYGRVRPYNGYLRWELAHHPLDSARWDGLPALLERLLDGDAEVQRYLFAAVEHEARGRGYGDVLNSWEPKLGLLR